MAKQVDKQTLTLIEEVKRQRAEISSIERPSWKTNCLFSYVEGRTNDAVNIHVESDVKKLIKILAFLTLQADGFVVAASVLKVDPRPVFSWDGFSLSDWIEDFKLRVNKIQLAAKKSRLEMLESRLKAVISPELQRQMELDQIAEELKA